MQAHKLKMSNFRKYAWFYGLAAPGMLYFFLFKYVPLWGTLLAFQNFSPFLGFWKSEWVGLAHFKDFFGNDDFFILMRNTLLLSFYNLIFYFPFVILLSVLLNELRSNVYRKFVQTVIYLPHFVSWVVIFGVTYIFFSPSGVINHYLSPLVGTEVPFMTGTEWFRSLAVFQGIWKEAGWGTIIFLAALAGINPELHEAATVDGASRWRKIWHVSLPGIKSTIVILMLLRIGNMLDANFQQLFLMSNQLNLAVSDVFELYVYRIGLLRAEYSYGVAVGLFNSVASLILVVVANWAAKKAGEDGVY